MAAYRRLSGSLTVLAGESSAVVTVGTEYNGAPVFANVAQAAADATLLSIDRAVIASGKLTVYGNDVADADVTVNYVIPSVDA